MAVLPTDVLERALSRQPLPVANALVELEAALSIHEQRDRMVEVFRALLRVLGGLALAGRVHVGPGPRSAERTVDERLLKLRRQALTDGEWVGLSRELLRPWRAVPEAHPVPGLVALFFSARAVHQGVDELLGMRKRETVAHGTTGDEAQVRAIVAERGPKLVELLEATTALWETIRFMVPLERPDGDTIRQRAWLLHGPTPPRGRWRVLDLGDGQRAQPNVPVLVDHEGVIKLALDPAVLFERASPEIVEDLFFLDGRRGKAAVFTAFPSMAETQRVDVLATLDKVLDTTSQDEDVALAAARPFRGLASFRPEDAGSFVGREKLVETLANRIAANAWVTVTGASGSGKTSLLAAGVGPTLKARVEREREAAGSGNTADTADYVVASMRPGAHPTRELRRLLLAELDGLNLAGADLAASVVDWAASRSRVVVLIIDQAEELLTLCRNLEERETFGALLMSLASSDASPVRVVVSVRVDFMAQLATIASIGDRYQRVTQVVATPAASDLLRILREPAERCGAQWEDGLAEEIVDGVRDQPAALALMSFVADRIWDRRHQVGGKSVLSRDVYDALGGVHGALGAYADEVIDHFTPAQRELARHMVLRLVTEDGTRAVVDRAELEEVGGDAGAALVSQLVDARLLHAHQDEAGAGRVELAHEALLDHWPQLIAWRNEDREADLHHARLRAATREWKAHGESTDVLWPERLLVTHARVDERRTLLMTEDERRFVEASRRSAEHRAKEILEQERRLQSAEDKADSESRRAEARQMVAEGLALDDEVAGLLLIQAGSTLDETALDLRFGDLFANRAILYRLLERQSRPLPRVLCIGSSCGAFSLDGLIVGSGSPNGTARLWDATSGAERVVLAGHEGPISSLTFSPDGHLVVTSSDDGTARIWDAGTGLERFVLRGHRKPVRSSYFSPDGLGLITVSDDGTARVWDPCTGQTRVILENGENEVVAAHWTTDGTILTESNDAIQIWDASDGRHRKTLRFYQGKIDSMSVSPSGQWVAAALDNGRTRVWNAHTGVVAHDLGLGLYGTSVRIVMFSPDETHLLTGHTDGTVCRWQLEHRLSYKGAATFFRVNSAAGEPVPKQIETHHGAVSSACYSRDGATVAVGFEDGTCRIFETTSDVRFEDRVSLLGHGARTTVVCSPDGQRVFTTDGVARLWDLHSDGPLASRTNLRICRDTHAVLPIPVPTDASERVKFEAALWAPTVDRRLVPDCRQVLLPPMRDEDDGSDVVDDINVHRVVRRAEGKFKEHARDLEVLFGMVLGVLLGVAWPAYLVFVVSEPAWGTSFRQNVGWILCSLAVLSFFSFLLVYKISVMTWRRIFGY